MIWLNGNLCDADNAISAQDRGLLLGESLFETLLLKHGIPQFWDAHMARLKAAAEHFDMTLSFDEAAIRQGVIDLLAAHAATPRQVLRLSLTGGNGGRGLVAAAAQPGNLLMQISPAPAPPDGLILADCDILRVAGQASSAHKTGSYMDNILARKQAIAAGADEAVMCNQFGRIACTAAGNIFAAFGNRLLTPPVSEGALPGIIRNALLAEKKIAGRQITEGLIEVERLQHADAIFVTNSVNQIVAAGYHTPTVAEKKQGHVLNEALPEFFDF